MHVIVVSHHIVSPCVGLAAAANRTNIILLSIVLGHVPGQVLLPEETSATDLTLERSVIRPSVTFFMASAMCQ
jgi:hypothetical protein